jgi:predicted nuclease of predicted toxin-antitoxin system
VKLLFDQNLSHQLCRLLSDVFPDGAQVRALSLDQADDDVIWQHAKQNGFAIVTLDSDFADIASLRGAPPKIIWLRCGNRPTSVVEQIIRKNAATIAAFFEAADAVCLELY